MSNPRKDLSVEKEKVLEFLRGFIKYDFCKKLYINGSRSPKSKRKPREDSDWDFLCVSPEGKYFIMNPRDNGLHSDIVIIWEDMLQHYSAAVEIWPQDKSGEFAELGDNYAAN